VENHNKKHPILLTCIDTDGTRLREDGFKIEKHEIILASISPPYELINFDDLLTTLKTGIKNNRYFFNKIPSKNICLQRLVSVPVISVHINPILHDRRRMLLSDAKIEQTFTFGSATYLINNAPLKRGSGFILAEALKFAETIKPPSPLRENTRQANVIVSAFTTMFNESCSQFLDDKNIPFLFTHRDGKVILDCSSYRFGIFSHPLRDAASLVNNMQLSFYLKHKEILFSKEFLERLI
jgi:hypothetical protein